jgi:glycerate-2-kinase
MRILNMDELSKHGNAVGRSHVAQMLDAGMDMVDPYIGIHRLMRRQGSMLSVDGAMFELKGDPRSGPMQLNLESFDRIIVVGAAKGVQRCALGLEEILGPYLTGGHVIGKHGDTLECQKIGVTLAGHPVPDECCEQGCMRIHEWIRDITQKDLVITMMGSGVSSLLTWPVEGVTVSQLRDLTYMMQIQKGALTKDLNAIRGHLDRFKGGKINRWLRGATIIHLVTNDLGGSANEAPGIRRPYFEIIESNGFPASLPDRYTFADAAAAIDKYDAWDDIPDSIRSYLKKADTEQETLKLREYETLNARLFGLTPKMHMVYPAVRHKAQELGYTPYMLCETVTAEAAQAGRVMASIALNVANLGEPVRKPCVLISSGELIVTVGNETGVGGRNQEFCIAAALEIAGNDKVIIGAVDTDGTDGPGGFSAPDAPDCLAGAIVDGTTAFEAKQRGIDLGKALKTHGTSAPLWALGSGVHATHSISALDLRVIAIME